MRWRMFLFISIALNLALLAAWFVAPPQSPASPKITSVPDIDLVDHSNSVQTNVVVRRQNFTWEEVESNDYATYIKNLREIGCPETTIRDIIVADVDALYAHRRTTEVVSADHQWWKSDPDIEAVQKAGEKLKNLDGERRTLLTRLLGSGWETPSNPLPPSVRTGISLSGPVLGELTPQAKQNVYDIASRTQQKIEAYQEAQQEAGKEVDPAELARLRTESRGELVKVLTPAQMEEFLLRYSQTATKMRSDLRGLNLTPDEFKTLFRQTDSIEQQREMPSTNGDAAQLKRQQELKAREEAALQQTLGKERFAAYKLSRDPVFQQAQATVEERNAPPALLMPIYQINQLTEAERQRIRNDSALTDEQKVDALASTQAEQEKSLQKLLSSEIVQRYRPTNSVQP